MDDLLGRSLRRALADNVREGDATRTRDEAEAALGQRDRLRLAIALRCGERGHYNVGATMGETPADLRAAAHRLLDALLDRGVPRLCGPEEEEP
jgi:hypothetical protein